MTRPRKGQPPATAAETYQQRQIEIAMLMQRLIGELERHRRRARQRPQDWSFVGDLGHVRGELVHAVAFLAGAEIEDIERELKEG